MTALSADRAVCNMADELLDILDGCAEPIALDITFQKENKKQWRVVWLRDKSDTDFKQFVKNKINLYYYNGYGSQHLDGFVWLQDGAWLERAEYDGSEFWQYQKRPTLPADEAWEQAEE